MPKTLHFILCLSFILILLLSIATPAFAAEPDSEAVQSDGQNISAEAAMPITDSGILDNLNEKTDVRWYTFPITVEGDAVLLFNSESSSIKRYCWECTVYAQDKTTVLKTEDVGRDLTYIAVNDLTAGTYYVKIQMTQGTNPALSPNEYGFSKGQYSINVLSCSSTWTGCTGDKAFTVTEAGTLLCALDGTLFLKAYDGEAVVGLYTYENGKTGPLLLGNEPRSIAYFSSEAGQIYEYDRSVYFEFSGEHYWASPYHGYVEASGGDSISTPLYYCAEGKAVKLSHAATELMNVHLGIDPNDGLWFDNFMASPAMPFVVGGIIVLIIVIIVVVHIRSKTRLDNYIYKARNYTPSYDDPPYTPPSRNDAWHNGKPWSADHSNAKDM